MHLDGSQQLLHEDHFNRRVSSKSILFLGGSNLRSTRIRTTATISFTLRWEWSKLFSLLIYPSFGTNIDTSNPDRGGDQSIDDIAVDNNMKIVENKIRNED